jgi:hypothetical protein
MKAVLANALFALLVLTFLSDVTDLAWSPGDRYLASVGLDSLVLVWCGYRLGLSHLSTVVLAC